MARQPAEPSGAMIEAAAGVQSLEALAGILRDLRRRHARTQRDSSLTYRELAERTGWSQAAIAEYFTARTLPPTDRFDALLEVLGASPRELRALAEARDRVEENQRRAKGRRPRGTASFAGDPGPSPGQNAGQSPVRAGTMRQLPADTALFTGRGGELGQLLALAERAQAGTAPGTAVITAVDGMGGVGKTALAIHAGHRLAERFPDGQLFLDLYGFADERPPCEPGEALAALLGALGVAPGLLPAHVDARAALYRDRLAGTRTLVILDNAFDEEQVRALLPASTGCLVLVTSRRRLKALDDAVPLPLGVLDLEEAVALLRQAARAGAEPALDARWEQVAEMCGRLPLALMIAGSLLRTGGRAWNLERLIDRLAPRRPGAELAGYTDETRSLTAVFDLSLRSLPEGEQELFRRLGLTPAAEIDAYAAAALLDADLDTAERRLERLAAHSLLIDVSPGRYRVHDLLYAHARARALAIDPPSERDAAIERLLHYWGYTAQSASRFVADTGRPAPAGRAPAESPAFADAAAARTWLRTERGNLDGAFDFARDRAGHTLALAAGLAEILRIDGPWTRALEIHRIAAEVARDAGRRADHATALADLGRVRHLTGDYPGAVDAHDQALQIRRALGDRLGEAYSLSGLGAAERATGVYTEALDAYLQALQIHRALGNRPGEAYALIDVGRIRQAIGDFPDAADAHGRALEIHRALGDRDGEAYALYALGRLRYAIGDYPAAVDAHHRALEIHRGLGNRLGEGNVLTELGRVRHATGDYGEAGDALTRALGIYRALGNRLGEAQALTELGRVRHATGDYDEAGDALILAMETYQVIGDRGDEAVAINYYAATLAATGRPAEALELYRQALAAHRELRKPDDEAASLEGIAEHHLAGGDTPGGTEYLYQALEIYERLGVAPDALRIRARLRGLESGPGELPGERR